MELLQREREAIINNEYIDHFDFDEVSSFIKEASKDLFISHKFKNSSEILVQPRGGFPTYDKVYKLYEEFKSSNVDVLPLTIDSNTRLNDYATAKKMLRLSEEIDGARVVSRYLDLKESDVISGLLSFDLDYGLNQIFSTLYKRATLALHKLVLPSEFFSHLLQDKVTVLPLMPINITQMFDEEAHRLPTPKQLENIRIITSSGGKLTPKMLEDINAYFPDAQFYSMHGLSEAFRSAYLKPKQLKIRPTSIGKAIPDVELYIINEKGEACEPREVGELIHRGACTYKGYWNSPEDTKMRFKSIKILDKVLHLEGDLSDEIVIASGDFVYKDEEGYIYFHSRKDEMIKTSGYRVSPEEIEKVVFDNIKEIESCAVFGVENERIEEEIVLVYTSASELSKNEILFELKKHLPNYMIPMQVVYKKSIPLHFGKINKALLKEQL